MIVLEIKLIEIFLVIISMVLSISDDHIDAKADRDFFLIITMICIVFLMIILKLKLMMISFNYNNELHRYLRVVHKLFCCNNEDNYINK